MPQNTKFIADMISPYLDKNNAVGNMIFINTTLITESYKLVQILSAYLTSLGEIKKQGKAKHKRSFQKSNKKLQILDISLTRITLHLSSDYSYNHTILINSGQIPEHVTQKPINTPEKLTNVSTT